MTRTGLVPTGLYARLGPPWWPGIAALVAVGIAGFFLLPDAMLLLTGLGIPLAGGLLFGYRRHSFWWAVVAVVAAWLVFAVVTTINVLATVFFGLYLAGAAMLGGALGKRMVSPPTSQ